MAFNQLIQILPQQAHFTLPDKTFSSLQLSLEKYGLSQVKVHQRAVYYSDLCQCTSGHQGGTARGPGGC